MRKITSLFLVILMLLASQRSDAVLTSVGLNKDLYTSDFMIGDVVVSIIFPESNGNLDINRETWSDDRKSQALSEIMTGLDWWTKQNPNSPLSFTYVTQTVETKYEPINRPYYDESLWIPDIMRKLGFNGDRFTATRAHINSLRNTHKTDWGFVIFVVDSLNDANGKFTDGLFAYAYLGGPFMVMTYDNNGYGIGNMDVVAAHEAGHVFHALDQYAGASSPYDNSRGYFPTKNGNHAYSSTANKPNSIMRGGVKWELDDWARIQLGWRDSDANGHDDILEAPPSRTVSSQSASNNSPPGSAGFSGRASVSVVPRQSNAYGYGLTVDSVANVEYRTQSGEWTSALAADGVFDEAEEEFLFDVPPSQFPGAQGVITAQDLDVRVVTSFSTLSGSSGSGGGSPGGLRDAHAYPNPYKPTADSTHTKITFSDLTPGAKVQIFTLNGEPVKALNASGSSTTLEWTAVDDGGKQVASGVYIYLITNAEGQQKEGKLAVIR